MLLPPYSPELNPVEKLWQYIKSNTITNKIYTSINDLMDLLCDFLKTITPEQIKSICSCTYLSNCF